MPQDFEVDLNLIVDMIEASDCESLGLTSLEDDFLIGDENDEYEAKARPHRGKPKVIRDHGFDRSYLHTDFNDSYYNFEDR